MLTKMRILKRISRLLRVRPKQGAQLYDHQYNFEMVSLLFSVTCDRFRTRNF
jgi:hypothetical protein